MRLMDNKKNNFQEIKTIFKLLNQQTQVSGILLDPLSTEWWCTVGDSGHFQNVLAFYIVIFIYRVSHQYRYKFNFKYQTAKVKSVLKSLDQNLQGATLIFIFSKKINIFITSAKNKTKWENFLTPCPHPLNTLYPCRIEVKLSEKVAD